MSVPDAAVPSGQLRTEVRVRYQITEVRREAVAIEARRQRLGWRVQVTNSPKKRLSLLASVLSYRSGWSLERDFHLLKDNPLGIRPLFVKSDAQIGGLVRLITLALRMLSVVEMQGRRGVAGTGHKAKGYYSGQPGRQTDSPSGHRILETYATTVDAVRDQDSRRQSGSWRSYQRSSDSS